MNQITLHWTTICTSWTPINLHGLKQTSWHGENLENLYLLNFVTIESAWKLPLNITKNLRKTLWLPNANKHLKQAVQFIAGKQEWIFSTDQQTIDCIHVLAVNQIFLLQTNDKFTTQQLQAWTLTAINTWTSNRHYAFSISLRKRQGQPLYNQFCLTCR